VVTKRAVELLLFGAVLVAVACGGNTNNKSANTPAGSASTTSVAPAAGTPAASAGTPSAAASGPSAAAASGEKPVRGGTLTVALETNPKNLDPLLSSLVADRVIHYQVYESLVSIGPDLKVAPGLAESWDTTDPKALVFKLRQGVKFQDGTPFDASAVKFNIDRILTADASPRKSEISTIASVDVVDPATVRFNLKSPSAPLLATLVDRAGMMVSPAAAQKYGADLTLAPLGAGTGPFRFVEWKQDDHITLERNPDYWRAAPNGDKLPYLDKLTYRIIVDDNSRLTNLKTGDVDMVRQPPAKDIAAIKKDSSLVYKDVPGLDYFGMELNNTAEPFNTKSLRQAVAWAIDRDQIVQTVYFGVAVASNGPIAPPMPAYDKSYKPFTRDLAKAKAKLAEGGKPNGFSFNLLITSNSPVNQQLAELLKDELKDIGVTVNLVPEEFAKLIDDEQKHTFQAGLSGWSGRIDPDGNTYAHFRTGGSFNYGQYSNPQVDDALDQAQMTYDAEKRNSLYRQANAAIVEDVARIFIYHGVAAELHTPKVKNFVNIADNIQRFAAVWKSP